jgi:hypothetical protein
MYSGTGYGDQSKGVLSFLKRALYPKHLNPTQLVDITDHESIKTKKLS